VDNANAYEEHLRAETLPRLTELDGFENAFVLKRAADRGVEFLVLTLWASREAITAFAGDDAERAVIPDVAAELLDRWDERATHYELVLVTLGGG
jgi:heme-degrading monooxygenase HmoA